MPKLPIVSGREEIRALERLGFVMVRQRGSYLVMRRGSSGCVVPNCPSSGCNGRMGGVCLLVGLPLGAGWGAVISSPQPPASEAEWGM
ncbi:MAG: addiction module toxin, HicA family [Caldilineaceae bacterium]|nr:addiction module toxin, HicA family [Caldilineaceae bacterium]